MNPFCKKVRPYLPGLVIPLILAAHCSAQGPRSENRSARQRVSRSFERQQAEYLGLQESFHEDLRLLAEFCDEKQLVKEAAIVRQLLDPPTSTKLVFQTLPRRLRGPVPASLPPDQREYETRLRRLRSEYAGKLYVLSRNALRSDHASFAMELVREVAFHDPDHIQSREILGFVRFRDEWVSPFEKQQRSSARSQIWHPRFGWLSESYVKRYENNERRYKGRWMTAQEEAVLRQDFSNGWTMRTDHFEVQTNHSLERAVEIGSRLEDFQRFFFITFAEFFASPAEIERLFSGSQRTRRRTPPHRVDYFRTQQEYNDRLIKAIPQIAITNGLYYTPNRTSYFFDDPNAEDPFDTLYHEATHQFLYEYTSVDRVIADEAHFWIIEGIACYMESFRPVEGGFEIGDPDHIRIEAARYRVLQDRYYVPLRRFASMGMMEFQSQGENLSRNYSQASGLAHFFMHYENGLYRDALVAHLRALYAVPRRGRAVRVPDLEELTGVSYDDLDRQYIAYMKQLSDQYDPR